MDILEVNGINYEMTDSARDFLLERDAILGTDGVGFILNSHHTFTYQEVVVLMNLGDEV